ncbi:MAG: hypothetical protein ACLQFR_10390 [Streptosporangiaceae bacterium]
MGALRCVDGSVLSVEAVDCRDRAGQPYEITLRLARDSVPFGAVGQRCGYQLSQLAQRISEARRDPGLAAEWPDPDDRFPSHPVASMSGDHEYFALRSRDRADLPGTGELRCVLRSSAVWVGECAGTGLHAQAGHRVLPDQRALPGQQGLPGQRAWPAMRPAGGHGRWRLTRRAVIEAWGTTGVGVRAVLTSAELVAFLDTVLSEPVDMSPAAQSAQGVVPAGDGLVGQSAGRQPGGETAPLWRQRGRVPDGIARSRLPAIRAQARGVTNASGDSPSRWGDVRR